MVKIRNIILSAIVSLLCCYGLGPRLLRRRRRLLVIVVGTVVVLATIIVLSLSKEYVKREDQLESKLVAMQIQLEFLNAQYRARQEELLRLQRFVASSNVTLRQHPTTTFMPPLEVAGLLRNISGLLAAKGLNRHNVPDLRTSFLYHLMPHLMDDQYSLRPAYRMASGANIKANIVIGVPTVKRDRASYLMRTLQSLVHGMPGTPSLLIVVYVGETDLAHVISIADSIEYQFPREVAAGKIEVISPPASFYPDFENLKPTLGDSVKRMRWRTKQNLDAVFLMAYAEPRGLYYLMFEDDVLAKDDYYKEMVQFIDAQSKSNPMWLALDFGKVGGIGKLLRTSRLNHFITYVQLFYLNMPIDWLLESYLTDQACSFHKKECLITIGRWYPKYNGIMFEHIGLFSSLKGKLHPIKKHAAEAKFIAHKNPPAHATTNVPLAVAKNNLQAAYEGVTFFWGKAQGKGSTMEFWFNKPELVRGYLFRSGNVEHISHRVYHAVVEVQLLNATDKQPFKKVGTFDEFGLAEGLLDVGYIWCIRIKITKDSKLWLILSEIKITVYGSDR